MLKKKSDLNTSNTNENRIFLDKHQTSAAALQAIQQEQEENTITCAEQELLPLNFARDTHLKTRNLSGRHSDDEIKRLATVYVARWGSLTNALIKECLKERPEMNTSNRNENTVFLAKYHVNVQNQTLSYMRTNMRTLVQLSGGVPAWTAATPYRRRKLPRPAIRQSSHDHKLMLRHESTVLDIENIFSSKESVRERWQTMLKTFLVELAHETWVAHTRLARTRAEREPTPAEQGSLYPLYKNFKRSPAIRSLDMGSVEQVPTRSGRSEDS
ncbi:hypothetical protein LTR09_000502 [Extremus antarcticus]|uniref:Uncharacterized protein n=1 Tax=Extremus antarcticus TaxID=702011 RepID=A0AAJ0GJS4_9PEZI|nr:hypothetical protein LTR09_000502 [Extremus antarcticus]